MKKILITGYRASELGIFSLKHAGIGIIKKAIQRRLIPLLEEGLEWVVVSGQWGVELWAAEAALELKKTDYPHLQLAVIPPFLEQEEKWGDDKKAYYANVLRGADYVNSVTKTKYDGPWQFKERDKFLLRNTDGLLLVYDEETGGSPRYIKQQAEYFGERQTYPLIVINSYDLASVAEDEQGELPADEANYDSYPADPGYDDDI
ncbi:DUF1273 domain-containing protein [Paenibacillus ferrarius]|uniref:DUF1273 domain-containing protein n=1 Tax=Paenibacillus ferrarius TaxID=1469647 RepID=UPI003D2B9742